MAIFRLVDRFSDGMETDNFALTFQKAGVATGLLTMGSMHDAPYFGYPDHRGPTRFAPPSSQRFPHTLSQSIIMGSTSGFTVLRQVIPTARVRDAAEAINNDLKVVFRRDKFSEYAVPAAGQAVCDDFIKVCSSLIWIYVVLKFLKNGRAKLQDFVAPSKVPERPTSIHVGIFHSLQTPDPQPLFSGKDGSPTKKRIFVTIALTTLNDETGWYTLLEGSHLQPHGTHQSEWKRTSLNLSAGDVIIWHGNLAYLQSHGGGGKFETLIYEVNG